MNKQIINLSEADDVVCEGCGSVYFNQIVRVKKISALLSPNGQAMSIPIQLLQCANCGDIDESIMANVPQG
tara:strand:+ start:172 stop:384 length:213 start_codon:yes stop_codon:yes gene_type:complete